MDLEMGLVLVFVPVLCWHFGGHGDPGWTLVLMVGFIWPT